LPTYFAGADVAGGAETGRSGTCIIYATAVLLLGSLMGVSLTDRGGTWGMCRVKCDSADEHGMPSAMEEDVLAGGVCGEASTYGTRGCDLISSAIYALMAFHSWRSCWTCMCGAQL